MLLDKKNAGLVIKIAAVLVAAAFIGSYIPDFFQGGSPNPGSAPTQQGTQIQTANEQTDRRGAVLKQRLAKNPKDFETARELGDLYWDAGGTNGQAGDATKAATYFTQATEAYSQALKVKPKNADVRTDMATAFFYSGNMARARQELNRVLAQDPRHRNALFNLGLISKQTGDNKTARSAWQRFLKVEPSGENADKVRQELTQLK